MRLYAVIARARRPVSPERKGMSMKKRFDSLLRAVSLLICLCLPTGCAAGARAKREKLDVSPYYDSTRAVFAELYSLVGADRQDMLAKLAGRADKSSSDSYIVTIFGRDETVIPDYGAPVPGGGKVPVRDFKIFLKSSSKYYIDYDEAAAALFGSPVSSGRSPYEGDLGVTRWDNYPLGGGEFRLCHCKSSSWIIIQKAE